MPYLKKLHTYNDNGWFEDDLPFLPQLENLHVGSTFIDSEMFRNIYTHAFNLKELYVCNSDIQDSHLTFHESVFPSLKRICLNKSYVTIECILSLIQSCPSLQRIYIGGDIAEAYAKHPLVVSKEIRLDIVEAVKDKPYQCKHFDGIKYFV